MPALGRLLSTVSLATVVALVATPTADVPPPRAPEVAEATVRRGDTWEGVLLRLGLDRTTAVAVPARLRTLVDPRALRPGQTVRAIRDHEGRVLRVSYLRTPVDRYMIRPDGAGWTAERAPLRVERRVAAVAGQVEDSLFNAVDRLGENASLAARFVEIFESEFDFAADALPGDRFRLLVEKEYVRGAFVGYGRILVAQYLTAGRRPLTGVGVTHAHGKVAYYDADGRSVHKMFLRAPLDFTRITSGYSHARRHPILGGLRPHLAIDYGAPIGTPVRAVADGVVKFAGWDGGNGITITLRHARGYETMYNHLSKVHVRRGQRVVQRQIIGRVGSTGLSTGPHLDYRVRKRGRFVNPLREQFVPGPALSGPARQAFEAERGRLLEWLEREAPIPSS
jgi:murein DD-endopeptidase MepM/ murein hydrolase activator NlpD